MDQKLTEIKKHYCDDFDPQKYRDFMADLGEKYFQEENRACEKIWADHFKDPNLTGTSLIDIGSGPTVHSVAPACHQFTHIVLSEYIPANIEQLKKWVRGDPDALDWTSMLERSAVAQGYTNVNEAVLEIQEKIRKHVKAIIRCDLLLDQIVPEEYKGPYDVVITFLTLESAAPDYGTYKKFYKKLNTLLKVGGQLLVKGFLMGGMWQVGDQEFPYLKVTKEQVHAAIEEAGFTDLQWKTIEKQDMTLYYEFTYMYIVRAIKCRDCPP